MNSQFELAATVLEKERGLLLDEKAVIERKVADINSAIHALRGTRPIADRPQA